MSGNVETIRSTIYLVRHGECRGNVEEDINLPHDLDVITEKGKLQASLLGKHLQDVTFTRVISSTYSRASDTATEILANLNDKNKLELEQDARIRERELGIFENRPMYDLWDDLFDAAKTGTKLLEFEVEGGESVAELDGRISSFILDLLDSIRQSKKPETILIVSHGILLLRLLFRLRTLSRDADRSITLNSWDAKKMATPFKNTGYHILSVDVPKDGPGATVIDFVKMNQVPHLDSVKSAVRKPTEKFKEAITTLSKLVDEQCVMV